MDLAAFIRTYHIRAPQIMWLLGAGASASAGVPTAGYMTWDFKRRIYCSVQRVPIEACRDLGSPEIRSRLQSFFDGQRGFPPLGDPEEYAAYFETVYPDDGDRRRYVEQLVQLGTPSYGHKALAALLALDRARIIWTTNFDRVLEDAAIPLLGSASRLVVATPDTAASALDALREGRWPLLVKLHGDFHSRRLKNTRDELRVQDAELRRALVQSCRLGGLAVVGYSGRDDSVMRALESAVVSDEGDTSGFPSGLYWFHRASEGPPLQRVVALLDRAKANGIDAHLIEVETFDELMADVTLLLEEVPEAMRALLDQRTSHVTDAGVPPPGNAYPIIRLNALPITDAPAVCRRVACEIGNTREVRDAVAAADADLIVARRRLGVLAFGRDAEISRTFSPYAIQSLDVHPIESHRLWRSDSAEAGLLLDALACALARERPLLAVRRRGRYVLVVDHRRAAGAASLEPLRRATRQMFGTLAVRAPVEGTSSQIEWAEAASIRVEYRLGRLWLLFEPTVWVEPVTLDAARALAQEFVRERRARRYNSQTSELLDAWTHVLTGGSDETSLAAFGIADADGMDARFRIARAGAFSRMLRGRALAASDS